MRPLNRIKKQKRAFAIDQFYIIKTKTNQWLFLDRNSHKVISSTPYLEELKDCITKVFKRYKHYDHYLKVMSKNTFSLPVPEKEYERRVLLHKKEGHVYDYIIEGILASLQPAKDVENQRVKKVVTPVIQVEEEKVRTPIQPKRLIKKRTTRL